MGLNKKQKKQIEALRNKIQKNQVLISAQKDQPDDPAELVRLQAVNAKFEADIEKIKSE